MKLRFLLTMFFWASAKSLWSSPCDTDSFMVKLRSSDTLICPGHEVDFQAEVVGGIGAYSYAWSHENNGNDFIFASPDESQWVRVTVSSEGCPNPISDSVFVRVKKIKASFSFNRENTFTTGSNIAVTNNSTEAQLVRIKAYREKELIEVYEKPPLAEYGFSFESSGNYFLKFMVYDKAQAQDSLFACLSLDTLHFNLKNDIVVYLPNAFSPGKKDQLNDEFSLHHAGVTNLEFFVFDRRGQRVFYSNEIGFSWDGRAENGRLLTGAYYYVLKAWNDEQEEVFSGILKII